MPLLPTFDKIEGPTGNVSNVEGAEEEEEEDSHVSEEESVDDGGSDSQQKLDAAAKNAVELLKVKMEMDMNSKLLSWTASSGSDLNAVETERVYRISCPLEWKCVVCEDAIHHSVYECQLGHLLCYHCIKAGKKCSKCSEETNYIQNVAMENVMDSLGVSCKYAKLGCKNVTKFQDFTFSRHEESCPFMPMDCPMPGCTQAGVLSQFAQHLRAQHKISRLLHVGCWEEEFDLETSTTSVMLRHLHSKDFYLLHHESTESGDRYQITSVKETGHKRKFVLDVKVSKELTYSYTSVSEVHVQSEGGLLVPKQPGGGTLKKRCKIQLL